MLKYITIIFALFFTLNLKSQCSNALLGDANKKLGDFVYIKHFKFSVPEAIDLDTETSTEYGVTLNKDVKYKFIIESAEEYGGKLIFTLFGNRGKIISSYNETTKKHYSVLEFNCKQSGRHFISLEFEDEKSGCALLVYSFEKT